MGALNRDRFAKIKRGFFLRKGPSSNWGWSRKEVRRNFERYLWIIFYNLSLHHPNYPTLPLESCGKRPIPSNAPKQAGHTNCVSAYTFLLFFICFPWVVVQHFFIRRGVLFSFSWNRLLSQANTPRFQKGYFSEGFPITQNRLACLNSFQVLEQPQSITGEILRVEKTCINLRYKPPCLQRKSTLVPSPWTHQGGRCWKSW